MGGLDGQRADVETCLTSNKLEQTAKTEKVSKAALDVIVVPIDSHHAQAPNVAVSLRFQFYEAQALPVHLFAKISGRVKQRDLRHVPEELGVPCLISRRERMFSESWLTVPAFFPFPSGQATIR